MIHYASRHGTAALCVPPGILDAPVCDDVTAWEDVPAGKDDPVEAVAVLAFETPLDEPVAGG